MDYAKGLYDHFTSGSVQRSALDLFIISWDIFHCSELNIIGNFYISDVELFMENHKTGEGCHKFIAVK